jgi:hypothetical protein
LRMCEVPITCLYIEGSSTLNPVVHGLSVAMATVVQRVKCMGVSGDGTENASNGEFHSQDVYNRVKDDMASKKPASPKGKTSGSWQADAASK